MHEVINLEVESGNPVIDGRALKVSLSKKDAQAFGAACSWDKTQRGTLTPEAPLAFFEAATSCILHEGDKLSAPCVATADNDELLAHVMSRVLLVNLDLKMCLSSWILDVLHLQLHLRKTSLEALRNNN